MQTTLITKPEQPGSDSASVQTSSPQRGSLHTPARPIRTNGSASGWPMRCTYLSSDMLSLLAASSIAIVLVSGLTGDWRPASLGIAMKSLGIWMASLIAIAFSHGAYDAIPPRPARQFKDWVLGTGSVFIGLTSTLFLLGIGSVQLVCLLMLASLLAMLLATLQRALCRIFFGNQHWWGTRFLVVGDGREAVHTLERMQLEPQSGIRPIGLISDANEEERQLLESIYLGRPSQIDEVAKKYGVSRAILIAHWFDSEERLKLTTQGTHRIRHWVIVPAFAQFPSLWLNACEVARIPGWSIVKSLAMPSMLRLKRVSDLAITVCVGILLLPLFLMIALLIKLTSKGPVIYGHERIGRDGRRFIAWKFRTMHADGDKLLKEHLENNPHLDAEWQANRKLKSDPRVTSIGTTLRSTSLDELPQLWNILVGEMSLVGPRPIVTEEIEKYRDSYDLYRKVQPGLTGLWQVSGRNNTTYDERVELDTYYVHNWSIWLDFYILACTIKVVLLGEGAY